MIRAPFTIFRSVILATLLITLLLQAQNTPYFMIKVVDAETGRGIPMVEFKTLDHVRYITDSNGLIAFFEPGLMGQKTFFHILGQGYSHAPDLFAYQGLALTPIAGDSTIVKLQRDEIAQRLYRTTGAGIYRDSHLLNKAVPIKNGQLNGKVMGQDSNLGLIYNEKLFWIWGDTYKPDYPLGNFSVSGATSPLLPQGGLNPEQGIDYSYIVDENGFSKKMIDIPGQGFVWLDWLINLKDKNGNEQLITKYARVKPDFGNHERGIAIYDDQAQQFKVHKKEDFWLDYYHVNNHPFLAQSKGKSYYYFPSEFTFYRVLPSLKAISTPAQYEAFTCLKANTLLKDKMVERDANGNIVWGWKKNSDAIGIVQQKALIDSGLIKPEEAWIFIQDFYSGERLTVNRGSVAFNPYLNKWIFLFGVQPGAVWLAMADAPLGPWTYAQRIAKHDKYFYNPVHHTFFDANKGQEIYFEGTYTQAFLPDKNFTPRYEYNQIMYKLDLADKRLATPQPLYYSSQNGKMGFAKTVKKEEQGHLTIPFYAYNSADLQKGLIPVYANDKNSLTLTKQSSPALFYALPAQKGKPIYGTWHLELTDGVFFNKKFKLTHKEGLLSIKTELLQPGLVLENFKWEAGQYNLHLSYFGEHFYLNAKLQGHKLVGTWHNSDKTKTGTWFANNIDAFWQAHFAPSLTELYVYTHKVTGKTLYSTKPILQDKNYIKSPQALCRVWQSPLEKVYHDLNTKWIGR